jgi:hypothetical protein
VNISRTSGLYIIQLTDERSGASFYDQLTDERSGASFYDQLTELFGRSPDRLVE